MLWLIANCSCLGLGLGFLFLRRTCYLYIHATFKHCLKSVVMCASNKHLHFVHVDTVFEVSHCVKYHITELQSDIYNDSVFKCLIFVISYTIRIR